MIERGESHRITDLGRGSRMLHHFSVRMDDKIMMRGKNRALDEDCTRDRRFSFLFFSFSATAAQIWRRSHRIRLRDRSYWGLIEIREATGGNFGSGEGPVFAMDSRLDGKKRRGQGGEKDGTRQRWALIHGFV